MKKIITLIILLTLHIGAENIYCEETEQKLISDINFDKEKSEFSYKLASPAYIRIRLGIIEGPLYNSLDWEYRDAGTHHEHINYTKENIKYPLDMENMVYSLNYFTEDDKDKKMVQLNEIMIQPQALAIGKALSTYNSNQMHKGHRRELCREPKVKIIIPDDLVCLPDGTPVVKNRIPLKIEIEPEDKSWLEGERYSVHVFIDNTFVSGELDGYTPYTYWFEPKGISLGLHLITVNINSYNDHIGTAHIVLKVEK